MMKMRFSVAAALVPASKQDAAMIAADKDRMATLGTVGG